MNKLELIEMLKKQIQVMYIFSILSYRVYGEK
jgi:uncharacterized protein (UPF0305 family)